MKINLPYFLARRLSRGDGDAQNSVMTNVATISVAIGLAVMIFAISVIMGFKKEVVSNLTGFDAHVQVTHLDGNNSLETKPISNIQPYASLLKDIPGVSSVYSYAIKAGILRSDDAMQGIVLKGVEQDYPWEFFQKNLIEGQLPRISDTLRTRDALISEQLASSMKLKVEDHFEMLFIQDPPRNDKFKVSGIYRSQFSDADKLLVVTDIRNVQKINGWHDTLVTGLGINASSIDDLDKITSDTYHTVANNMDTNEDLMVVNMREKNSMIFDWLATHDLNALIIIIIMLIVSIFNIAAALLVILLEKSTFIGIMKSLGMKNSTLQKTFILRSASIILKGVIWGNIIGIACSLIQKYTGILKLDASGYFLSQVPIYINWFYVILLNIGVFVIILVCQTLPTMMISKISPEKTLKIKQ